MTNADVLLISDKELPVFFKRHLNTTDLSISGVLKQLIDQKPDVIIIYAELKLIGGNASNHDGVELIKHIRLTPQLSSLREIPILLLHWYPLEVYVKENRENMFLFSPGIFNQRLPNVQIDFSELQFEPTSYTDYLIGSERDVDLGEHSFRNELAIEEFTLSANQGNGFMLGKELWFKKEYYRHYEKSESLKRERNHSEPFEENTTLKILLVDDQGERWKEALNQVFGNLQIVVANEVEEAINHLSKVENDKTGIRNKLSPFNINLIDLTDELRSINSSIIRVERDLARLPNEQEKVQKELSNQIAELEKTQAEFGTFVDDLQNKGRLLDLLISSPDNLSIGDLNSDVSKLFKTTSKYNEVKNQCDSLRVKLEQLASDLKTGETELNELKETRNNKRVELTVLRNERKKCIQSLSEHEFDLILLDMYLDEEDSKNHEINSSRGAGLLQVIKEMGFCPPVMIFSASSQSLLGDYSKLIELNAGRFFKGLTPPFEMGRLLKNVKSKEWMVSVVHLVNQTLNVSRLYSKNFFDESSEEYETVEIADHKLSTVKKELQAVRFKLTTSYDNPNEKQLANTCKDIVVAVGKIQEARITVRNRTTERTFWYHENSKKNKVGLTEEKIRKFRNKSAHVDYSSQAEWISSTRQYVEHTCRVLVAP